MISIAPRDTCRTAAPRSFSPNTFTDRNGAIILRTREWILTNSEKERSRTISFRLYYRRPLVNLPLSRQLHMLATTSYLSCGRRHTILNSIRLFPLPLYSVSLNLLHNFLYLLYQFFPFFIPHRIDTSSPLLFIYSPLLLHIWMRRGPRGCVVPLRNPSHS